MRQAAQTERQLRPHRPRRRAGPDRQAAVKDEVLTGLLYLAPDAEDLHAHLNTVAVPFNKLGEKDLCPGAGTLEKINASLR